MIRWLLLLPIYLSAQCDTSLGTVPLLGDFPGSYTELTCYEQSADTVRTSFDFIATHTSSLLGIAYSAIGCDLVAVTNSVLLLDCDTVGTGFVHALVPGLHYYWHVTVAASGGFCQGVSGVCPYRIDFAFLPIEMVEFCAQARAGVVKLSWATLSEINSRHVEVQQSNDAQNYTAVGTVQSAGQSSSRIEYAFSDSPAPGDYYYRLVEVDYNGDRAAFAPVFVRVSASEIVSRIMLIVGVYIVTYSDGSRSVMVE